VTLEARVVKTSIDGLDLVLGGGVRLLERVPGAGESAALLVRGAAGTGKTLLANHIAATLARQLVCDVVVACLELLPTELEAQLAGFEATRGLLPVRTGERVGGDAPRVFARIVEPDLSREDDPIGDEMLRLLELVERSGGAPRVLVVDSLSDGYGLGGKVKRVAADALVRFAASRGLCLVLVEEVQQLRPSPWCFVVDTVIELRLERLAGSFREERTLTVTKNRLGPSDAGPHELALGGGKLMVLPEPDAWDRAWAGGWWKLPVTAATGARSWGDAALDEKVEEKKLAPFEGTTTLVRACDLISAATRVTLLMKSSDGGVLISLQGDDRLPPGPLYGDALVSPHRLQAVVIERLKAAAGPIEYVAIGDLSALYATHQSVPFVRTICRTVRWLAASKISVILYETAPARVQGELFGVSGAANVYKNVEGSSLTQRFGEKVIIEMIPNAGKPNARLPLPENVPVVHDLASGAQFVL